MKDRDDFKEFVEEKITELRTKAEKLEAERSAAAIAWDETNRQIKAYITIYDTEFKQPDGETSPQLTQNTNYGRFTGMKIGQALRLIRQDNPNIKKKEALKVMQDAGYDFQGKKPLPSVHFAWIALEREKQNK